MNRPDEARVLAEVQAASEAYEQALRNADTESLIAAFWRDPRAVRLGDDEELFGFAAIEDFRRRCPAAPVRRQVTHHSVVAFGERVATVNIVSFYPSEHRVGRQSQLWLKTQQGWRVAQAHVSWPLRSVGAVYHSVEGIND